MQQHFSKWSNFDENRIKKTILTRINQSMSNNNLKQEFLTNKFFETSSDHKKISTPTHLTLQNRKKTHGMKNL